ncbi:hypothetical protein G6F40_014785 [Rhizopus arrhizus]|nr:hypothetical protein G6F40_014785 [Rhizopus arrhizus]
MDLHRLVGDPHRRFRGGQLGHRRFGAEALALALHPCRAQGQQQGCIQLALHVGDLGLGHLESTDGRAKGLALLHVFQGRFIGGPCDADGLRGNADAAGVEHAHGDLEALALLAQHIIGRGHVVVELDLAGGRSTDAQLRFGLATTEAGRVGIDDEGSDATRALVRLAHREQHDVLGHRAGGDPALLAPDCGSVSANAPMASPSAIART